MRPLSSKPNVVAPGGSYPFGRIKDNPGDNTGTPVNEEVYGDFHQFFERLMDDAGVTPNGSPENSSDGFQLNEALQILIDAAVAAEAAIRSAADTTLTNSKVAKAGDTMSGNLAMGGNKVTGLAASSSNGEAVRHEQATTLQTNIDNEASTRAAADTTLTNTKVAKAGDTMSGPLAMGGNNITGLAAAITNGHAVRYEEFILAVGASTAKRVTINIGEWDMDATAEVTVATPSMSFITFIRNIFVLIRNDSGEPTATGYSLIGDNCGSVRWDATNIYLNRVAGGVFDTTAFNETGGYNRGVVVVDYV